MMLKKGVFEGIRVLDIGHIVAGPIAASVLADFGADVIKIERPVAGDPLRWMYAKDGIGLWYKVEARNKKSITLNLKTPEGREIFHKLVAVSDVIVENFRPGVMERLGHDWETLSKINPKLIMCRLSGFGQTGPYASRRAYGRIGEAFGGFAAITGEPDGPPMHSLMSLGDTAAGMWAAMGIAMALYWRDAQGGGVGQVIDMGLYEGVFRQIEQQIIVMDQLGAPVKRTGTQHSYTPFSCSYTTKDKRYFSVSAVTAVSARAILQAMGVENDERFNTWDKCRENSAAYAKFAAQWMADHTLAEVDAAFRKYDAPGTPVMDGADLINDPHVLAREMVVTVEDSELGPIRMQGIVPKLSKSPGRIDHSGQKLGASNDLIYGGLLGMSVKDIDGLREKGVI